MPSQQPEQTRAEREALSVLETCLTEHPLPHAPSDLQKEQADIYRTDSDSAKLLNCIALVRDGTIIPYVDLQHMAAPETAAEKMSYLAYIARCILDGMMDAFLASEERRQRQERQQQEEDKGDEDEGGACHV